MKKWPRAKVLILHHFMPQWRLDFFESLRQVLDDRGMELNVLYGRLRNENAAKKDEVDLPWGFFRENRVLRTPVGGFVWQPSLDQVVKHDLVIVNQHNRLLMNHVLMVLRRMHRIRLGFWGHGLNLQDRADSLGNKLKRRLLHECDWWFAYTEGVKTIIKANGYPEARITVVQNAIDTAGLSRAYALESQDAGAQVRQTLGIGTGPVGIFCGGMYKEKRIPFLLDAARELWRKHPDFHLLVVGDGPDASMVRAFATENSWVHYVGPKFGNERIPYFQASDVFLMPGLVGLAVLDSFALETPMITTTYPFHSPEIEYLIDGQNGRMTADDLSSYVDCVSEVLKSPVQLERLRAGCRAAHPLYTLEAMVDRFAGGVCRALGRNPLNDSHMERRG